MSTVQLLFCAAVCTTLFCAMTLGMGLWMSRPSRASIRLMEIVSTERLPRTGIHPGQFQAGVYSLMGIIRSKFNLKLSAKSKSDLETGGYRSPHAGDVFLALQYGLPIVGVLCGALISENTFFWIILLTAVGYLLPNIVLSMFVRRRKVRIVRALPDAMDLLVICVEAGLGLEQALLRVGEELKIGYQDIQEEFARVHFEQRAGVPRLEAWHHFADRIKLPEISTFVSMLSQTERFGTPIVKALTEFSDELRIRRRQRAEEAAAKTKVKIVFPLVFFIFPCLFIVLLAPALMSLASSFQEISR